VVGFVENRIRDGSAGDQWKTRDQTLCPMVNDLRVCERLVPPPIARDHRSQPISFTGWRCALSQVRRDCALSRLRANAVADG
jgi:hypothetical protein